MTDTSNPLKSRRRAPTLRVDIDVVSTKLLLVVAGQAGRFRCDEQLLLANNGLKKGNGNVRANVR